MRILCGNGRKDHNGGSLGASLTLKFGSRYEDWPHDSSHEVASLVISPIFLYVYIGRLPSTQRLPEFGPSEAAGLLHLLLAWTWLIFQPKAWHLVHPPLWFVWHWGF